MLSKEQILEEIRKTTKENGGIPLGQVRFEKETGVKAYDWHRFWARFSDAQKEAGFLPNTLQKKYDDEFVIQKMIGLIRKLGKFPTYGELRIEKNIDSEFPSSGSLFDTKERKGELAYRIFEWCREKKDYQDILEFCVPIIEQSNKQKDIIGADTNIGEVYLFKSGRYYKIGKTNDTVRRGSELKIQLPESLNLIHSIKTDDPSGIEAYWHKRFEAKRMNGEWFDLNLSDIKAFKRWRKIF